MSVWVSCDLNPSINLCHDDKRTAILTTCETIKAVVTLTVRVTLQLHLNNQTTNSFSTKINQGRMKRSMYLLGLVRVQSFLLHKAESKS